MSKLTGIVVWLCRRFNRREIEKIIEELTFILKNPHSEMKPKDEFLQEHPNFRNFVSDGQAALSADELSARRKKKQREQRTIKKSSSNTGRDSNSL